MISAHSANRQSAPPNNANVARSDNPTIPANITQSKAAPISRAATMVPYMLGRQV